MNLTIDKIENIVREASAIFAEPFSIEQKGGFANIVTSADLGVQDFLISHLRELLPGCGFLCEEKDVADKERDYVWIIDPIDGTANYARHNVGCAICVGLKDPEGMLMSVVYMPWLDKMYTAERGKGAYMNGQRIHVSDREFSNAVLCTALPVYHKEHAEECSRIIVETFRQCNDIRRLGAAAPEMCCIAAGQFELYFEYLLSPWDFAATSLIVTEAGGHICKPNGEPLNVTEPSGVVVANTEPNLRRLLQIITSS
ncbi:MAG: inositol monophosphatase [Muribaculaceae bacterium]|nr:inositol monophosphatase [Muribaculaceae bacterium]